MTPNVNAHTHTHTHLLSLGLHAQKRHCKPRPVEANIRSVDAPPRGFGSPPATRLSAEDNHPVRLGPCVPDEVGADEPSLPPLKYALGTYVVAA